jgi:2-polyprenyl-3-methyl-5-hydroxy-6-metoxy-1,4-benzoquinol methylase
MSLCPVCKSKSRDYDILFGHVYRQCRKCFAVFCTFIRPEDIQNDNTGSTIRNQPCRLDEVYRRLTKYRPVEELLDYGCGNGELVSYFNQTKPVKAIGIDRYNLDLIDDYDSSLDAITMIEVIEHILDINTVVKKIHRALKPGGLWYIETSLIEYCEDSYIDPRIGHCLIHSVPSINKLAKGLFKVIRVNQNVYILQRL